MNACGRTLPGIIIMLLSTGCATLGADSSSVPGAVLHATGMVQVNGAAGRETTTLFSGDSIQTDADSVANITASGSSVLIMPKSSVKFLGKLLDLMEGSMSIATSVGMAATAYGVTVTPPSKEPSKFEVVEYQDSVFVVARQGSVIVSDGQQTSDLSEGQQTTRKKKREGAIAAPGGSHATALAIVGGAAGATIAAILFVESNNKKCVSPSGNKKCKCRKDKKGKDVCELG